MKNSDRDRIERLYERGETLAFYAAVSSYVEGSDDPQAAVDELIGHFERKARRCQRVEDLCLSISMFLIGTVVCSLAYGIHAMISEAS